MMHMVDNSDIEDIFVKFVKKTRIKLELICIIFGLDLLNKNN